MKNILFVLLFLLTTGAFAENLRYRFGYEESVVPSSSFGGIKVYALKEVHFDTTSYFTGAVYPIDYTDPEIYELYALKLIFIAQGLSETAEADETSIILYSDDFYKLLDLWVELELFEGADENRSFVINSSGRLEYKCSNYINIIYDVQDFTNLDESVDGYFINEYDVRLVDYWDIKKDSRWYRCNLE